MGKNIIIFGADMSSFVHIGNKNKDIFGEGATNNQEKDLYQGYTIMEATVSYFVNAAQIYQLKAKDSEIKYYVLCLGNISKHFTINNMKKKQDEKEVQNFFLVIAILLILEII